MMKVRRKWRSVAHSVDSELFKGISVSVSFVRLRRCQQCDKV